MNGNIGLLTHSIAALSYLLVSLLLLTQWRVRPLGPALFAATAATVLWAATVSLDAWDFGLSAERRLLKNIWLEARTGIGGLRGFRFNSDSGQVEDPDISVGSRGFFALSLKLRPAMLP
ncbi:hypothetical protein [Congregibacter sp.]|uniref:hypothetical protein n=1 Tax=Congregibacter sp. TaxID=2744308 RepID=UPI003F6BB20F